MIEYFGVFKAIISPWSIDITITIKKEPVFGSLITFIETVDGHAFLSDVPGFLGVLIKTIQASVLFRIF